MVTLSREKCISASLAHSKDLTTCASLGIIGLRLLLEVMKEGELAQEKKEKQIYR